MRPPTCFSFKLVSCIVIHIIRCVWFRTLPHICLLFSNIFHWNCCTCELGINEYAISVCFLEGDGHKSQLPNDLPEWSLLLNVFEDDTTEGDGCLHGWVGVTRRDHMGPSFPFPYPRHGTSNLCIGLVAALAESGTTLSIFLYIFLYFMEGIYCFP